ncbi:hypothetical protein Daesc_010228 [Daldinia eschscholtzii]|uniref:PNPLA domain-containing protein n=1 Tax=Daldinia eschscholtzii TaxID=292717 RepID=A0AAX6M8E0_9PEZI
MTTTEAIEVYYDFSGKIFSKKNRKGVLSKFVGHPFHELPLEKIIKDMVSVRQIGELMMDPKPEARSKAFVCSQPAHKQGQATRFRTYEPPSPLKRDTSLDIPSVSGSLSSPSITSSSSTAYFSANASSQSSTSSVESAPITESPKPEDPVPVVSDPWNEYRDIKIWEAARATTAAPSYFDPIELTRGGDRRKFIDGAMGCNNPAKEVVDEAAALFGTDCILGCLVSLGTGFSGEVTIGEAQKWHKKLAALIINLKKIATDTETVHKGLRSLIRADLDTYFRFQLPTGAENIRLHDYRKLDELSQLMQVYIEKESAEIDKVVRILVDKAKPRGITLGQIAGADHGQIVPPKKEIRTRPHVSNFFVGRQEYLETLAEALCPDPQQPNRKRHHLLYGQPGAGKSQTASKFLDDYGEWFDMILWVDAESRETLEVGFKELRGCSQFGYTGDGSASSLVHWLETTDHSWILVLDDVRGDVSNYVPNSTKGAVFFTSQDKFMKPAQKSATQLDVLGEDEAVQLLINSARLEQEADRKTLSDAAKLTKSLGYLPLAIDQAAGTIRMQQWAIEEYAKKFESHRDDLLKRAGSEDSASESLGLQAVHASFDVTYKVLNMQSHDGSNESKAEAAKYAIQLLSLFSFYHNEGLMGHILKRAVELRPEDRHGDDYGVGEGSFADLLAADESGKWIEKRWQQGMDLLIAYSLVKVSRDTHVHGLYSIHGLVHGWAKERMPEYIRRARAKAARLLLFDTIPESQPSDAQPSDDELLYIIKVLPHARAAMKNTEEIDGDDQLLKAGQHYKYGLVLDRGGLPQQAFNALSVASEIYHSKFGWLADVSMKTCQLFVEVGKRLYYFAAAFRLARQVHGAMILKYGPEHLYTIRALVKAAALIAELGPLDNAENILRDVLVVSPVYFPDEELMTTKTALAMVFYHKERIDEAKDMFIDVVQEYTKQRGPSHPDTLASMSNLSIVLTRLGEYEEAEDLIRRVMEAEKQLFGPDYHDRATTLHNLATIYFNQEKYPEALEIFREAKILVQDHWRLGPLKYMYTLQGIALTRYKMGNRAVGIKLMNHCCRGFEVGLSNVHIYTAIAKVQRDEWIWEEENGLPIQTAHVFDVVPMFRY